MNHFMNLPKKYRSESSKFKIYPIKYEKDLTFGKGTSQGPKNIIKASQHLEYYDEQFDNEPFIKGIETLKTLNLTNQSPEEAFKKIKCNTPKGFFAALGGDHSITYPIVSSLFEKTDFSVIILDAHSDMRHSWNNSRLNHACVSKRISEKTSLCLIGVRSQDIDEAKEIASNKNIFQIKAYDYSEKLLKNILPKLKSKVYISIDADVFNPSFIRNTGTPEPGGFSWDEVINILKIIFESKEVISADIVEFSPNKNFQAESYALAKLIYKLFSMKLKYSTK